MELNKLRFSNRQDGRSVNRRSFGFRLYLNESGQDTDILEHSQE